MEVPSLPGCVSAGNPLGEWIAKRREAAESWIGDSADRTSVDLEAPFFDLDL